MQQLLKKGKNVLLCIDVKGAKVVSRKIPGVVRIFVKTPSLAILKRRLKARGSEAHESFALRLQVAKEELEQAVHYDYVIVNDDFHKAFKKLNSIVTKELE